MSGIWDAPVTTPTGVNPAGEFYPTRIPHAHFTIKFPVDWLSGVDHNHLPQTPMPPPPKDLKMEFPSIFQPKKTPAKPASKPAAKPVSGAPYSTTKLPPAPTLTTKENLMANDTPTPLVAPTIAVVQKPSAGFLAGYRTYILAASGVIIAIGTAVQLYGSDQLTTGTGISLILAAIGSAGLATIRAAVSSHFGVSVAIYDMLMAQLKAMATPIPPGVDKNDKK